MFIRILSIVLFLLFLAPVVHAETCPIKSIQQIVLYKNAWMEAQGNPAQSWLPYDNAYSAQTFEIPFDQLKAGGAVVCQAEIKVVWRTLSPSADVGIGVFACPSLSDAAHTDLSQSCKMWVYFAGNDNEFTTPGCGPAGVGPRPCLAWPTDIFNNFIQQGVPYSLTIGTFGNGSNGPAIYDVEIEIAWEK